MFVCPLGDIIYKDIMKFVVYIHTGRERDIMGRKWNNIKEKKASKDANTSRIYAKFGVEIYVAKQTGRT